MIGTRILFLESGPVLDFLTPVVEFECTLQNAMVNVGTNRGSDPLYPDRGTDLQKDGLEGRMVSPAWVNHSANFAALETTAFLRATEMASSASQLKRFQLQCVKLQAQTVTLAAQAESIDGQVIGVLADL